MDGITLFVHDLGSRNLGSSVILTLNEDDRVSGTLRQVRHYMRGENRWTELTIEVMGVNLKYRMKFNRRKQTPISIITQYTTVK
jgi:hypothetical protein